LTIIDVEYLFLFVLVQWHTTSALLSWIRKQ